MQGTYPARHVQSTSHVRVGAPRVNTDDEVVPAQSGSFRPSPPTSSTTTTGPSRTVRATCTGRSSGLRRRRRFAENTIVGQWHIRANVRRPGPGPQLVLPTVDELTPAGYRPVYDRAEALARFDRLPGTAWLRVDSYATRRAVWQALVEFLSHETGLAVAGQAAIAARASVHAGRRIARSTAGNHLRALADEQAVGVETGASKEILNSDRDRASVYVILAPVEDPSPADEAELTAEQQAEVDRLAAQLDQRAAGSPSVDELGHLPEGSAHTHMGDITQPRTTTFFSSSGTVLHGTTDATSAKTVLGRPAAERHGTLRREHPERFNPRTAPEREIAVAWISSVMGWKNKASRFAALRTDKELLVVTRPYFAAGWSPAAVVRAFRTLPDGSAWPGPLPTPDQRDSRDQPSIQNLWALLTHRLAAWRDPLGNVIAPPLPTEQPPRGRPRKARPVRAEAAPVAARGAEAELAIAGRRAHLARLAAQRSAERELRVMERERIRAELANLFTFAPPAEEPSRPVDQAAVRRARAILRARTERVHRHQP